MFRTTPFTLNREGLWDRGGPSIERDAKPPQSRGQRRSSRLPVIIW